MSKLINDSIERRAKRLLGGGMRSCYRVVAPKLGVSATPLIVNSLPKSGTHLMLQLLGGLPGLRDFNAFIATTPSVSMNRRSDEALSHCISRMVKGELCGAHLHWSPAVAAAVETRKVGVITILRDPRDVFWSEMQYLLHMNRWHRAGRMARQFRDPAERFDFLLYGSSKFDVPKGMDWPSFSQRVVPYLGWAGDKNGLTVFYEDLRQIDRENSTLRSVAAYLQSSFSQLAHLPRDEIMALMIAKHDPGRSHTYRSGVQHEWKDRLSQAQIRALHEELEGLEAHFRD